jgi:UDP-hydrolysing UDP-N-acetyl-D-glucosamine 2-epimerase
MRSVIDAIQKDPDLELQLILGGMVILEKYGRILHSIDGKELSVNRKIYFVVEGESLVTMTKSAGIAVSEFATAFEDMRPDIVMVIADRFECLPIAMAASYMNILVAHVEGGEISGSIDESIRHAISKLSHIHFPASMEAAKRLERMGEDPSTIFAVGGTSMDIIRSLNLIDLDPVRKYQANWGMGAMVDLEPGKYIVVIQHPVTTEYEKNYRNIKETIAALEELRIPSVWILPNMDAGSDGVNKGIRKFREHQNPDFIHFFKSMPIEIYAPLLQNCACIVGNSSSGIREAAFLGTPCVNVGTRQNGRQRGHNVVDCDYERLEIIDAIKRQVGHGRYEPEYIYGDGFAADKIVDILKTGSFKIQKTITF